MRHLTVGIFAWLLMGAAAGAQTPNAQVIAPIQKFLDSFNKGDMAVVGRNYAILERGGAPGARGPRHERLADDAFEHERELRADLRLLV